MMVCHDFIMYDMIWYGMILWVRLASESVAIGNGPIPSRSSACSVGYRLLPEVRGSDRGSGMGGRDFFGQYRSRYNEISLDIGSIFFKKIS